MKRIPCWYLPGLRPKIDWNEFKSLLGLKRGLNLEHRGECGLVFGESEGCSLRWFKVWEKDSEKEECKGGDE